MRMTMMGKQLERGPEQALQEEDAKERPVQAHVAKREERERQ